MFGGNSLRACHVKVDAGGQVSIISLALTDLKSGDLKYIGLRVITICRHETKVGKRDCKLETNGLPIFKHLRTPLKCKLLKLPLEFEACLFARCLSLSDPAFIDPPKAFLR